jgi:predicted nucleotidyltransferase
MLESIKEVGLKLLGPSSCLLSFISAERYKGGKMALVAVDVEELSGRMMPILRRFGVRRASIFGSLARGEGSEGSDVDVLVELEPGRSLLDLAGLKVELEEALGRRVDVLTYDSLHPLLRDRVLKEQKPIL